MCQISGRERNKHYAQEPGRNLLDGPGGLVRSYKEKDRDGVGQNSGH